MHDRLDPVQIAELHVANIEPELGRRWRRQGRQVTAVVQPGVEADHVMPRVLQDSPRH
jgi:hypothetical protein